MAASVILLAVDGASAAAPISPLSLGVSAPASVNASESRDIVVTIANGSVTSVLVLPNLVRLDIAGVGAEYVPYPGPAIDPWQGARELAPGATTTVVFRDASDKLGVWRLPPGAYRIIARYDVPPDLAPPPTIADPSHLWRGRVVSPPAAMTVN